MQTFELIIRSIVCIIFPIIISMIFAARDKNFSNDVRNCYLEISLFTSFFLLTKLVNYEKSLYFLLILNIPLFICLRAGRTNFAMAYSTLLTLYFSCVFSYDLCFIIGIYVFLNVVNQVIPSEKFSSLILIFGLICYVYYSVVHLEFINSFCYLLLFLVVTSLTIYAIRNTDKIIRLNNDFKEIEKEKNLKQSLFKITHEIKNPLTVCSGYIQMLQNETDIEKYKRYTNIIGTELKHALLILEDLKDLNKVQVKKENMNLCALLDEVVDSFGEVMSYKDIELIYNLDKDIYINGDYDKIKQVILNVLKNSVEALETRDNPSISIDAVEGKKYVSINIKDNGIGMEKDTLKHIFDSFFTTKGNGNGLGLYISKEIIDRHEGKMIYKSKIDVGTTCIIKIKK